MKRLILILCIVLCLFGCKQKEQIIVHHEYVTHVKDSVVTRDSVVIIPQETYTNIAWNYDTLRMETSLATAVCYVDSLWLRGTMKNKKAVQTQYIEIEKWRDSIVYKEKPVPYEVEKVVTKNASWKVWLFAILASLGFLVSLCWIFRKWIIKLISLI